MPLQFGLVSSRYSLLLGALLLSTSGSGCAGETTNTPYQSPEPPPAIAEPAAAAGIAEPVAAVGISVIRRSGGEAQIDITRITKNDLITGQVSRLALDQASRFKVVVYVRTDLWYIHPFAGQGQGSSWAELKGDLSWELRTVMRQYTSDRVAALLVERGDPISPTVQEIAQVPAIAWVVIQGTGDL